MIVKRFVVYLLLTYLISIPRIPASAHAGDRYAYDRIQQDFAHLKCPLNVSATDSASYEACRPDDPIDLERAVRIALKNNPDNHMAMARIRQARARVEQAAAAFYPAMGLYTEYMQGDAPSAYLFKKIDQRQLPPNTDFNDPGWFQNFEAGVKGRLNLFNGGKDYLNHEMARTGLTISRYNRQAVENELAATVIHTYYDYLAALDFIQIAEKSVETVQSQLDIMKVRFEAGGVLKSDILSLEVRLAQAREDVVRSRNGMQMASAALANVLGVAPDQPIQIKAGDLRSMDVPATYQQGILLALKKRPELQTVREQLRQSRMAMDLAGGDYWPTVDLQGKYYYDDPDFRFDDIERQNWTVAMVLNWYFFTGMSTPAGRRIADARLAEMLAADRKAVLGIQLDVKNAYLKNDAAAARLEVAEKSVNSAEESLSLVKKQFEGGSATITRYLEAELARNSARINATSAFYDREKAKADMARAVGILGPVFANAPSTENQNIPNPVSQRSE